MALQGLVALALVAAGCAVPAASTTSGSAGSAAQSVKLQRLFPGFRLRYGGTVKAQAAAAPPSAALPGANDLITAGHSILAATGQGIWRSTDGGLAWHRVLGGAQFSALTAVTAGGYAALGSRERAYGAGPAVLATSTDGVHWQTHPVSAPSNPPYRFGFGYRFALSSLGPHGTGIAVPDAIWTFFFSPPLRSTDGGRIWKPVTKASGSAALPSAATNGVALADGGRTAYVTAAGSGQHCSGAVWRSTDAGLTWSLLRSSCSPYPLQAVQFISARQGFAAGGLTPKFGGGQVVESTSDGGLTWHTIWLTKSASSGGASTGFARLDMVSARDGWAIAGGCTGGQNGPCGGLVYTTADGGRQWHRTSQSATSLVGLDPSGTSAVAGDDDSATTAVTADRGLTWREETRPGWIGTTGFAGIEGSLVWTTSFGDYLSSSAGTRWTRADQLLASRFGYETWLAAPPDRLLGLPGSGGLTVVASSDGGRTWVSARLPDHHSGDMTLTAALGAGGTAIAVTGAGAQCVSAAQVKSAQSKKPGYEPPSAVSTLFTSADGGARWGQTGVRLPFGVEIEAPAAVDGSDLAIVDACNRLQISSDGGRRWHAQAMARSVFCSVAALARPRQGAELWLGCAAGGGFWLLHSADGGRSWTAYRLPKVMVSQGRSAGSPAGAPELDIAGLAATAPGAAVMPAGGSIWRTADGGRSWVQSWPALAASGSAGEGRPDGGLLAQAGKSVAGAADQHSDAGDGRPDQVGGARGGLLRLRRRGGQYDKPRPDLPGQRRDLLAGQVGGQMLHVPAVLPQAGRGHQGGQRVPLAGRRCHHGYSTRTAGRLPGLGRDDPLADGGGAVLACDRHPAGLPLVADHAQRRRDHAVAQVGHRDVAGQPLECVAGRVLVAVGDGQVEPVRLGAPVPDLDLAGGLAAVPPLRRERADIFVADLVAAADLASRQLAAADPGVRRLVVHAEHVRGLLQSHLAVTSRLRSASSSFSVS